MKNNIKLIVISCVLAISLSGCFTFPRMPTNKPQRKFSQHEVLRREPKIVDIVDEDGKRLKVHIGESVYSTYDINLSVPEKKISIWMKLWGIFGFWIIVIIAIAIFVPGGLGVMTMILGRVMKVTRRGMGQAVNGIEKFLQTSQNEDEKKRLLAALSETMDSETKGLVSELKRDAK